MLRRHEQLIDVASFEVKSGYWKTVKKTGIPAVIILCAQARFNKF